MQRRRRFRTNPTPHCATFDTCSGVPGGTTIYPIAGALIDAGQFWTPIHGLGDQYCGQNDKKPGQSLILTVINPHRCANASAVLYSTQGKDSKLRKALLAAVCLLALPTAALASEIDCNGYRYGMKVRDLITLDVNNEKSPACEIPNKSRAWSQIKKWCNDDDYCTFKAHVERRNGNRYIIDRIVGPVKWGD